MVSLDNMLYKHIIRLILAVIFLVSSALGNGAYAVALPEATGNNLLLLSEASSLPVLRGIKINPKNPFNFDFIIDSRGVSEPAKLKEQAQAAIAFFLTGLAIPQKDLWVNLSPYEKGRIVADSLATTELGSELLSQDYILKQLAASLTYPETEAGKRYWDEINNAVPAGRQVGARLPRPGRGNPDPTINFQRVWIVPDNVKICEDNDKAFVASCRLKVLTDEDYAAMDNKDAFRTHILPLIEKEVNEGKNFASLRQAMNSLVLAIWFKGKLKDVFLTKAYADKALTQGLDPNDPQFKQKTYEKYLKAFATGAYDYIKKEKIGTNRIVKRRYFSGGVDVTRFAITPLPWSPAAVRELEKADLIKASVDIAPLGIYQRNRQERAIRVDLAQDQATRRYTDGHEAFHALVDELRIAGINMRWLSVEREEKLAEIFGIAFRDGHQTIPAHLLDDLKSFQDRLNTLLHKLGKPTMDDLLEYLQDQDRYDHRNPETLAQILNDIDIAVNVSAATADELLKIHKSRKGFIRAEEAVSENDYPTTVDLLDFASMRKDHLIYPSIPRVEDFGDERPIMISWQGLRGIFVEPHDAALTMKRSLKLRKFFTSNELRQKIDGVVYFKVVNKRQVGVGFMSTEENLARVMKRYRFKRANKELLGLAQVLPKYEQEKHVAISERALEGVFTDPEYAAEVINKVLVGFMASAKTSDVIMGITFFKAMRSSAQVPVFLRTPENIALVAEKFGLKIADDPKYLDFIRNLPVFDAEHYLAVSEPGFKGIYRNTPRSAKRINKSMKMKEFMASPKITETIYGVEYTKMRAIKNNRVVVAFAKTPKNIAQVAKQYKLTLDPKAGPLVRLELLKLKLVTAKKQKIKPDAGSISMREKKATPVARRVPNDDGLFWNEETFDAEDPLDLTDIYRPAIPPKDRVGGIDVSEKAVNIQTEGKFDASSININSAMAEWKNIRGVTFDIISLKKITAQELFAAP